MSLISPVGFVQDLRFFIALRLRIHRGPPLDDSEKELFGSSIHAASSLTITTIVATIFSQFSPIWRREYYISLADRFIEYVIRPPKEGVFFEFDQIPYIIRDCSRESQIDFYKRLYYNDIKPSRLRLNARRSHSIISSISFLSSLYSTWPNSDRTLLPWNLINIARELRKKSVIPVEVRPRPPMAYNASDLRAQRNWIDLWKITRFMHKAKSADLIERDTQRIFKILNSHNQVVLYHKITRTGQPHNAIMEQLVWEVAKKFGVSESFAETQITPRIVDPDRKPGCLQQAIAGQCLADVIDNNQEHQLPMKEVIRAMMISIVFGFYDAHSKNLIITPQNRIAFFDNSRCFPHSNELIQWGESYIPPFRSGLFELKKCYQRLTDRDWDFIESLMELFHTNLKAAKQVFQQLPFKLWLKSLPRDWFNLDLAFTALDQRIEALDLAVKQREALNLRDLVFLVFPDYKFFAAMSLTQDEDEVGDEYLAEELMRIRERISTPIDIQTAQLGTISGYTFNSKKLLRENKRILPDLVMDWTQNGSLSFDAIIELIAQKIMPPGDYRHFDSIKLWKKLKAKAKPDLKDCYESASDNPPTDVNG